MIESSHHTCFAFEAFDKITRFAELLRDDFDGDDFTIPGPEHHGKIPALAHDGGIGQAGQFRPGTGHYGINGLVVVWTGCDLIFSFDVQGTYLDLFLVFFLGSLSLTSLGLVLASRGTSEEFTTGILNFISWPMMFLSEVWFSMEGAPQWVKTFAKIFPLTHMLTAARKVMHEGAGLIQIGPEIIVLSLMTLGCLVLGATLFSWNK